MGKKGVGHERVACIVCGREIPEGGEFARFRGHPVHARSCYAIASVRWLDFVEAAISPANRLMTLVISRGFNLPQFLEWLRGKFDIPDKE